MKKKLLSKLLVFVMVLSLMPINMLAYGQSQDNVDEFFKTFKTKFGPILDGQNDAVTFTTILNSIANKQGYTTEVDAAYAKLSTEAKTILTNNGFKTTSDINKVLMAFNDVIYGTNNATSMADFLKDVKSSQNQASTQVRTDIENMYGHIYDALPKELKDKNFSKYGTTREAKVGIMLKLMQDVYSNDDKIVTEENGKVKVFLPDTYMAKANESLAANVKQGEKAIVLNKSHIEGINVFLDVLSQKINADSNTASKVKDLSKKLGLWKEPTSTNPGNDSGGPGGGGPSTPPADTVSKDGIDVKKEGNTTVAVVKTAELSKVVQNVLDKITAGKVSVVNIDLRGSIKDLNAKIDLPVEALKKLEGKEANIVIKTDKLEVTIPVKSLDLGNEKASIRLDVKEVAKDEVKGIVKDDIKAVAKVIELNLYKVDGTSLTKIDSKFAKKVVVGIDISDVQIDKDKAVVLFVEDENSSEVVGIKVKGSTIYASLEHFSKYAVAERNVTLDDIQSHWSKKAVESMAAKNVVNGYADNTFKPENKVTRAEFAKLLVGALELDMEKDNGTFSDMNSHWSKDYVETAYKAGIIKGSDGKFNPDANITRAEMATMIGRALETDKKADLSKFADSITIPTWAKEALSKAVAEDLINGDNGSFRPNDNTTRGEAATVIYRLFNK